MNERTLQWHVTMLADKHGVLCFHVPDSRLTYGAGFPDVVLSGTKKTVFAELKVDNPTKGYLKPNQRQWRERLEHGGEEYYLWRPRHLLSGEIEAVIGRLNQP